MSTKPAGELVKGDRINPDLTFRRALGLTNPVLEVSSVRKREYGVTVSTTAGICLGYHNNEKVRVAR